jgi:hypothetical protein
MFNVVRKGLLMNEQKLQKEMLPMMNNKNIFDLRQYLLFPQHENIPFIPLLFAYLLSSQA